MPSAKEITMDKDLRKFDHAMIDKLGKNAAGKDIPKELLESVTGGDEDYVVPYECPRCHINLWCHPVKNIGVVYYCKSCGYSYAYY